MYAHTHTHTHTHTPGSDDGHVRLILELSHQVSTLDAELRQAHETIQKLKKESTNGEENPLSSSSCAGSIDGVSGGNSSKCVSEWRVEGWMGGQVAGSWIYLPSYTQAQCIHPSYEHSRTIPSKANWLF